MNSEPDFVKGLIVVVISTFVTFLYQLPANGGAVNRITAKQVVIAAVCAAGSYFRKNPLTNSKEEFMN